jgi:hypothetical protein
MTNGPIADGLFVCHKCDNPPCCNPAHLFIGTHQDNMDDCRAKGRKARVRGSKRGQAKLSEWQAKDILRSVAEGVTHQSLARKYGVSRTLIGRVANGKLWTHVPGPKTVRPKRKISREVATEVLRRALSGESSKTIAADLGVTKENIMAIKHRRTWRELDAERSTESQNNSEH